jgi:hypothetical protein
MTFLDIGKIILMTAEGRMATGDDWDSDIAWKC